MPHQGTTSYVKAPAEQKFTRQPRRDLPCPQALRRGTRSAIASPRAASTRPSSRARAWRAPSEVGTPSLQPGGDRAKLLGRVLLSQWRAGEQVFAPRKAADEHRLEADRADEAFGEGDGLRIVAGDRDADRTAGAVGVVG